MKKEYIVYLMMNNRNSVIYTGITNNLDKRVIEHQQKINPQSFTAKYNVNKLVYYEMFNYVHDAINREKQIKGWRREKKLQLIRIINPKLEDLSIE
ncbi:MAG: GIY-YIG nuclease family protein [Candidatus Komeilibacteria bacterium]|nr:GIY-YIG nuclease family protein [Candidatus Komeilibacteria bacterium]